MHVSPRRGFPWRDELLFQNNGECDVRACARSCVCMYVCVCAEGGHGEGTERASGGVTRAPVRSVSCSSSSPSSSSSSGWTFSCACSCCSSASKVPASGTFASAPKQSSAASQLAPRVAAAALVVAAPLGWAGVRRVPQQRRLGLRVVRRVGGRRHLDDVDRAASRGEGAGCGVQVRLQHARHQPVRAPATAWR